MALTSFLAASQHGPRPLPLFLDLVRTQTDGAPDRRAAALAGLAAYQNAKRPRPRPQMPVIAQQGRARIFDYGAKSGGSDVPVLFIPSLINPPMILDMRYRRSLLRWLAGQGVRPMLLDWGTPDPQDHAQDITQHIEQILVPLLRRIGEPVALAGYCLGGTIAAAAAQLVPARGLAMIAAPWQFSAFGAPSQAQVQRMWTNAQPMCRQLGLVPIEVLQTGFWQLDPARTVRKFERFAGLDPKSAQARSFVALEDWANSGAALTYAAGQQLFDDLFAHDLSGRGEWRVGGAQISPRTLSCPTVEFISLTDRIVPAATAVGFADQRQINLGHVGMMVGSQAKWALWRPLAQWLTQSTRLG